jgi:hypothetical protein
MSTGVFSDINWLALLVAAIAYFMLGALWFSKGLFGARWAGYVKLDMNDPNLKKGVAQLMLGSFVLMVVACFGLAVIIARINPPMDIMSGIKIGLLTGICFAVTSVSITYLYEVKPMGLHVITGGYHLVGLLIASIILVMWR